MSLTPSEIALSLLVLLLCRIEQYFYTNKQFIPKHLTWWILWKHLWITQLPADTILLYLRVNSIMTCKNITSSTITHLHGLRFYYVVTDDEIKSHTVAAVYEWIESHTGWRSRRCNNIYYYSWYVFSWRYPWYVDKNVATKMFV